jgi:hypothetical protein
MFVSDQLASRDATTRAEWGDCEIRLRVMDVAAETIRKEFLWPNANYLPGDPLCALCVRRDWEREFFAAVHDIERNLHLPRRSCGSNLVPIQTSTFGQYVDAITTLCPRLPG